MRICVNFGKRLIHLCVLDQNNGFVPSQPQQPFFNAFNNNGFQTMQPINNFVCIQYDNDKKIFKLCLLL